MASIIQIGGRWRAQVRRRGMRPQCASFATREEAETWAAAVERKHLDSKAHPGNVYPTPNCPLGSLLSEDEIYQASEPVKRITGVYFLLNGTKVVYVGSTTDVHRRLLEHRQAKREFDRYLIIEYRTAEHAKAAEKKYIRHLRPRGNDKVPLPGGTLPRARSIARINPAKMLLGE